MMIGRRGINVHYSDGRNRRRFRQFQTYELSDRYRIAMSGRGESCSATCARVTRVARGGPPAPDRTVSPRNIDAVMIRSVFQFIIQRLFTHV